MDEVILQFAAYYGFAKAEALENAVEAAWASRPRWPPRHRRRAIDDHSWRRPNSRPAASNAAGDMVLTRDGHR